MISASLFVSKVSGYVSYDRDERGERLINMPNCRAM